MRTAFTFTLAAVAIALAAVASLSVSPAAAAPREPETLPVQRIVAEALGRLPLVGIGELHGNEDVHELILSLVRDDRVAALADDIVVEFGNATYQDIIDRFVAGEDVAIERVREAWRNTVNPLTWDSPVYERFFRAVREANARRHAGGRQWRVVLGDVPVDWPAVRAMADLGRLGSRDAHFASAVEREVLAKGRRAILVAGQWHLFKRNPSVEDPATTPDEERTAAEILLRRHPGKLLVIQPLDVRRGMAGIEDEWRERPAGTPWAAKGTALGAMEFGVVSLFGDKVRYVNGERIDLPEDTPFRWPKVEEVLDVYLWLGPKRSWRFAKPAAETYEDAHYLAELRRRAKLMGYPAAHFKTVTGKAME